MYRHQNFRGLKNVTPLNDQPTASCDITLNPFDNKRLVNLCGRFDEHLRQIEEQLHVQINCRGNQFHVTGQQTDTEHCKKLLEKLYDETKNDDDLTPAKVHLFIKQYHSFENDQTKSESTPPKAAQPAATSSSSVIITKRGKIRARGAHQETYVENIRDHDITFGIGPAGTGKTYLAVACAIEALEQERVRRILLVRPAVEAGERLGFLPGDLSQKIDPYLRPLYDALYEMLGFEQVNRLIERNIIEVAPLAYMRGRTLNDSFIILDEAQNSTKDQMKMLLTRMGFGSKTVITGDITQIDLARGTQSGLKHAIRVLDNLPDIKFSYFDSKDVVRHPLVQQIVQAYDQFHDEARKK